MKSLLFGLVFGLVLGSLYFAYPAIQQQVGINGRVRTSQVWEPICGGFQSSDENAPLVAGDDCLSLVVGASLYGFNGTNWDRVRTMQGDGIASTGILGSGLYGFNGTTLDRLRTSSGDSLTSTGLLAGGNYFLNESNNGFQGTGTVWSRVRSAFNGTLTADASGNFPGTSRHIPYLRSSTNDILPQVAIGFTADAHPGQNVAANGLLGFNNSTFDRIRTVSSSNLSASTSVGITLTANHAAWSVTNTPATATQATASKTAGGAGIRHVATGITVCIAAGATAQTPILAHLRDGSTGAGTIKKSWAFSTPVNTSACQTSSIPAIIGTANTAMTIEFTGAGVAGSQQTVSLEGYSVQ